MKAAKELLKEGSKETKISFKFQLYFRVSYGHFVERRCFFWTIRELWRLTNKALKCPSRFRKLISSKSAFLEEGDEPSWCFYNVYFGRIGSFAANIAKYQATKPNKYMCLPLVVA